MTASLGLVAIAVAAVAMLGSVVARAGAPVEGVTTTMLVVAVAAGLSTVVAVAVGLTRSNRDVTALSAAGAALTVAGLLLVPLGAVLLVLGALVWVVVARRTAAGRSVVSLTAGVTAAVALGVLTAIWAQGPLVECRDAGVAIRGRPWWDSSSGDGSSVGRASSSGQAVHTGTFETPGGRFAYRCEGSTLVTFDRSDRSES